MSLPIIAIRNTAEVEEAILEASQGGRPLLASGVDPNVYANHGATAAKAQYLCQIPSAGSMEAAELAAEVAKASGKSEIEIRTFINSLYEVMTDFIKAHGAVRIETPWGVLETMVAGSLPTAISPIDPEKNYAYLNLTPSEAFQRAAQGLTFFNATEGLAPFKVETVRQAVSGDDMPFAIWSEIKVRGTNLTLDPEVSVKFLDLETGVETPATIRSTIESVGFIVRVPNGLNVEHKYDLLVTQTIDGMPLTLKANKAFTVAPSPDPDHEIRFVKQAARENDHITFDESQMISVYVTHNNGSSYVLTDTPPKAWIVLDPYTDGEGHTVEATLDQLVNVASTAESVTFKNPYNTAGVTDDVFWDHTGTLYVKFSDGKIATHKITFVEY